MYHKRVINVNDGPKVEQSVTGHFGSRQMRSCDHSSAVSFFCRYVWKSGEWLRRLGNSDELSAACLFV